MENIRCEIREGKIRIIFEELFKIDLSPAVAEDLAIKISQLTQDIRFSEDEEECPHCKGE